MKMVDCENLFKIYKTRDIEVVALQGLDLSADAGEFMAVVGSSGSGKSTLMNMIGGLDHPSAGKIVVDGNDLLKISETALTKFKREVTGFVWQNNARNLVPYMSALENVELPMIIARRKDAKERALELLETVGMLHRKDNKLGQLSGGEQQRVAIAIALGNMPKILLADEPTGSVDSKTAKHILEIFRDVNRHFGVTVIIVTHDRGLAKKMDRVVEIRDGKTGSEYIRKSYSAEQEKNIQNAAADADDLVLRGPETDGDAEEQIEYTILDRSGRLQIPGQFLEEAGLKGERKVRVDIAADGKIVIYK